MIYVYLLGKPCVGKDTIAAFINEEYGLTHIRTGRLVVEYIRDHFGADSEQMQRLNKGELVKDGLADKIIEKELRNLNNKLGAIIDGYPRHEEQYNSHKSFIDDSSNLVVFILLEISDKTVLKRSSTRLICSACQKSQINEKQTACNFCFEEGVLYKRADDNNESMKQRLHEFATNRFFIDNITNNTEKNIYVHTVDCERDIDSNLDSIRNIMQKYVS